MATSKEQYAYIYVWVCVCVCVHMSYNSQNALIHILYLFSVINFWIISKQMSRPELQLLKLNHKISGELCLETINEMKTLKESKTELIPCQH
jgi:hypothetical protein